ncbi:hypothetical protein B9Z19DRAFT_1095608 [Tuber borchii]|uniref:Uncharacterized protein n=1 Tax=Tuber borchii TaxID=42251 RepID=A0A2T6ZCI0_TUBBO|nr:hypothetical protein B9Z19DRAFT_1095608 [Tuber borchii]
MFGPVLYSTRDRIRYLVVSSSHLTHFKYRYFPSNKPISSTFIPNHLASPGDIPYLYGNSPPPTPSFIHSFVLPMIPRFEFQGDTRP